ncbi:Fe-S cluster assembly protein SufD [Gryllotalpicola ginsengisoli]|uniref:Fe-S cluster assembly protein SufD n=1 Tax=Gryllotalpicola ginsengisoli TaxID=444608 RepID=UPI0003B5F614|nr:Fe-S cluster assembly protein SufD [Gryllotalpicola ginsengisoli]
MSTYIETEPSFVPVQTRSERPTSYDPADFDAPTGREVDWKFSDVARLSPLFEDADGDPQAIDYEIEPEAFVQAPLAPGQAPRGEAFHPEDLPSAIAWKRTAEALHLVIPAGLETQEPVRVSIRGLGAQLRGHAHLVIEAQERSRAIVVLEHTGSARFAENVEVLVRDHAALTLITVQEWEDDAIHASAHQAVIGTGASLKHVVVSLGGAVVRVNPSVRLAGEHSEAQLLGAYFADAGQHLESQVYVYHEGRNTKGRVLYKGALQGASAHTVWIGDVLIGRDAVGTDSYEQNRNLVLTDGARADSVPNLEIETGDIEGAGHASATGRFDDEQLFYLQSRGITEEEARRLVVRGFLLEIVQQIGVESLAERLAQAIEAELSGGAS